MPSFGCKNVRMVTKSQLVPTAPYTATSQPSEPKPGRSCVTLVHGCCFVTRCLALPTNWTGSEKPGIHDS